MVVLLVILATAAIRIRLIGTPLERDEGEYAYAGQLMLQGIPPYRLACNMKLPGTYAAYALIMGAFGQTIAGIHLGLLLVNAGAIVLIYLIGKRLFAVSAGLAACAAYALLSLSGGVLGTQAHATQFVVLAAMAGVWLLLRFEDTDRAARLPTPEGVENGVSPETAPFGHGSETRYADTEPRPEGAVCGRLTGSGQFPHPSAIVAATSGVRDLSPADTSVCATSGVTEQVRLDSTSPAAKFAGVTSGWPILFASGVLFGVAFLLKQHGILFGVFAAGYLVARRQWKKLPVFLAGAATPFALTCLWLWRAGVFDRFWFWTFTYASHYGGENSLRDGAAALAETFGPILWQSAALWALAAVGLVLALLGRRFFVPALLLFSFAAVCPGLYFRPHYFVLILPAVALLAGSRVGDKRLSAAVFAGVMVLSLLVQRDVLFRMSPVEVSRELYGLEPFPEAIPVAAYIRDRTHPDDRIAVLGSEPEIYFYAHRHSATSFLYMEPLVEAQPFALRMQDDMVAELERTAPAYVVRFPIVETLSLGGETPARMYKWWADYGPQHYRLVGIADMQQDSATEYRWDAAAETYRPRSLYHLAVYRHK
jgi:hypothetical protein